MGVNLHAKAVSSRGSDKDVERRRAGCGSTDTLGCGIGSERLVEGLVSESRRLRQGAGGHPGGDRRRSVLMLLCMKPAGRVKSPFDPSVWM